MSLVTTPTLTRGESSRLRQSTSAVLPLPTGPATPTRNARMATRLKQEISLGQRQHAGGFAGEPLAIGADFVGAHIECREERYGPRRAADCRDRAMGSRSPRSIATGMPSTRNAKLKWRW